MVLDNLVEPMTLVTYSATLMFVFGSAIYYMWLSERKKEKNYPFYIWGNILLDTAAIGVLTLLLVGIPSAILMDVLAGIILAKAVAILVQFFGAKLKWWHSILALLFYVFPTIIVWGFVQEQLIFAF